jgi:hypothetical protein
MIAKDANNIGNPASCSLWPYQQRRTIMMTLTRTILSSALLLSSSFASAYAQSAPPAPAISQPMFDPMPVMVPLPPNGCVWAGRPFSDGAGFCVADKVMQTCTLGKWAREANSEGCRGALADTR